MSRKTQGIACSVLSAIIYGFTPILARLAFEGGANGITVAFLRGALPLPLLFLLLRRRKTSLHPSKNWKPILAAGVFGIALTTLLLYMSYNHISVGMATTLHFTYPALVSLACIVLFKDPINRWKIAALVLCSLGIVLFLDSGNTTGFMGTVLALLSGVTYALYMLWIDKSNLRHMHYLELTFYLNICIAATSGFYGLATGQLNLSLTPTAWILCALVGLFTAFGAIPLMQQGIKLAGAPTAAILSTMEPLTSILLGVLVLGEAVSGVKIIGSALILTSVLLLTISKDHLRHEG